jgi:Ca2+-binding RTX toxin-like protein
VLLFDHQNDQVGGFDTIQEALDNAGTGYTILVGEGIYTENLVITKGVSIVGAEYGVAGTDPGRAAGPQSIINGQWTIATTDAVTIDGFTFNDVSPEGSTADSTLTITAGGNSSGHSIENNVFFSNIDGGDTKVGDGDPARDDRAISITTDAHDGAITVENNYITGTGGDKYGAAAWGRGVWSDGNGVALTIAGNTIENTRSGLNLDDTLTNSPVSVHDNTFTDVGTAISLGAQWAGPISAFAHNNFNNVDLEFNLQNLTSALSLDVSTAQFTDTTSDGGLPNDGFFILGGQNDDTITGTAFDDVIAGNAGNDTISAGAGNDVLDGGPGADTLNGGTGNDVYYAAAGDVIVENPSEGIDEVRTTTSFTLPANVENLTLLDGASNTQTFDDMVLGPILNGESGWVVHATGADQEIVDLGGGNHAFRMSSDPDFAWFAGPYSPGLSEAAGEPSTGARYDSQLISFDFQAVNGTPDGSRLEIDFGNANATDRNNFMVLESFGSGIRIAVSEPDLSGNFSGHNSSPPPNDWRELASGIDAATAHHVDLRLTYVDGQDNDVIKVYLDGNLIGTTTTFENYHDSLGGDHATNAEANLTDRVFFRPSANGAPQDGSGGSENAGFNIDNLTTAVYNNTDATGNDLDNVIVGNSGDNTLTGAAGNDTLNGGAGNDWLAGGAGNDTLKGGAAADTFKFAEAGSGNVDTIVDYYAGEGDKLDLSALLDAHFGAGSNVSDFVQLANDGSDVKVQVDTDGATNGHTWTDVAVLSGYHADDNQVLVQIEQHAQAHALTVAA